MLKFKKLSKQGRPDYALLAKRRLELDFQNLSLPNTCGVVSGLNLFKFKLMIIPNEGLYEGRMFVFNFVIPKRYPIDPPKVKCLTKLHHPNIDLGGKVSVNILREDWTPALDINSIILGINLLLAEPDYENAVNTEAWNAKENYEELQRTLFERCFKF